MQIHSISRKKSHCLCLVDECVESVTCFVCGAEINACSSVFVRPLLLIDQSSAASGHRKYCPSALWFDTDCYCVVNVLWWTHTVIWHCLMCLFLSRQSSLLKKKLEEHLWVSLSSAKQCCSSNVCVNVVCVFLQREAPRGSFWPAKEARGHRWSRAAGGQ